MNQLKETQIFECDQIVKKNQSTGSIHKQNRSKFDKIRCQTSNICNGETIFITNIQIHKLQIKTKSKMMEQ